MERPLDYCACRSLDQIARQSAECMAVSPIQGPPGRPPRGMPARGASAGRPAQLFDQHGCARLRGRGLGAQDLPRAVTRRRSWLRDADEPGAHPSSTASRSSRRTPQCPAAGAGRDGSPPRRSGHLVVSLHAGQGDCRLPGLLAAGFDTSGERDEGLDLAAILLPTPRAIPSSSAEPARTTLLSGGG